MTFMYTFYVVGGPQSRDPVPRFLAGIMCMHYAYRGWIFPYLIRVAPGSSNNFSLLPAVGGSLVTVTHGYLNAKWYATAGTHLRGARWFRDVRFKVGLTVYLSGFIALVYHDYLLRELRATPGPRYRIPHGGVFDYVTSAGYLCELWTWMGFALMSWGPNGCFIFAVSLANLVPRAAASHTWYLEQFGDEYAELNRTRLIPFVW